MSFVVGLTGGIGSGKSAAADCFAALGVPVVDTDAIAHELTAPGGAAIEPIRRAFGQEVLTAGGALDRAAMRCRVFADPAERTRLEGILHPMIRAESEARLHRATGADYALLVVPLLVETKSYRERMDRIVVVDCPEETQVARVMARSALPRAEVLSIMAAQASRAERLAIADDVIANAAGLAELRARVAELHAGYLEMARHCPMARETPRNR
jgi:dephospho-CoA kinase